ncbi:hypothetical protein N7470_004633 [Penicillium chermesinum]|nr:hypothetical protein N7470_004633 [Penicillium chermesinum]
MPDAASKRTFISRKAPRARTPVLINFCGSGFILATFGSDDEYCRYVANSTDYTVIDVQYRLAPENPFPAAYNDGEDVVKWVLSQPDRFDPAQVSLSGFSAGANIALSISSSSQCFNHDEKQNTFRTIICFYGPTDMNVPTPEKTQSDSSNWIMRKIFPGFSHLCHKCLNMGQVDPKDPRISPSYADPQSFPDRSLFISAAQCSFGIEAEKLSQKIGAVEGKFSAAIRMNGCAHGWDKEAVRGTSQCRAKDEAYAAAVKILKDGERMDLKGSDI